MNKNAKLDLIFILATLFIAILLMVLISAEAPQWDIYGTNSSFNEDTFFSYNFTANVTDPENDSLKFSLTDGGGGEPIIWSVDPSKTKDFFHWIFWNDSLDRGNSTSGILNFYPKFDNETGKFNISVDATDGLSAGARPFYFIINATNDAPVFSGMQNEYNLTQDENFLDYLNATDEENHYPLIFNITFFGNCTHADWSGRVEGENCSILSSTNFSNISAIINFTPERNDVGTYWANITVMDFGNSSEYDCPHEYCTPETYNLNQTTLYSSVVKFNVFSILNVNISDCQNKIFQENESGTCQINITTRGEIDSLNISSLAGLRSYVGEFLNESWFFSNLSTFAENFSKSININFTPQKTEIGNWTIDFTVEDITAGESNTTQIYVYVNKSIALDDAPDLISINDINTSIELSTTISLTVYDSDLLIPHKDNNYGGYNETINFNITILNASDLSQKLNISDFDVEILYMPVLSGGVPTNKTTARIQFTPNSSDVGNYTINLTVTDLNNVSDTETFNLLIISNQFPYWNDSLVTEYSVVEGGSFYLNLSNYSIDHEEEVLTFSNFSTTHFPAFFLNTTSGEINISGIDDEDVGVHLVNITISDGYLTNTTTLTFTINNLNETPFIKTPLLHIQDITIDGDSNMNTTEDSNVIFYVFINDTDFNIRQQEFYKENLTINLTIQGNNTNLFELTFESFTNIFDSGTNYSKYSVTFTPVKSDVGVYNISINVSDISGLSDFISFNLTINSTEHNPVLADKDDLISSIEESILVDFNATDVDEDDENLIFKANITLGDDFINGNETIFNTTSGILNIGFNSSMAGVYTLNISVNDTTGKQDSFLWNLTVYDYPVILLPLSSFEYSMSENVAYTLNFSINHTVGDTLNYKLYIDDVLRDTTTGNGNASNFLWNFTSNFTDETTCSGNVNLKLNVSNSKLSKVSNWSLQIDHSNAPLIFLGSLVLGTEKNIGGSDNIDSVSGSVTYDLEDHFSDIDATDSCVNQKIGFITTLLNGSSLITHSITNWTNSASSPSATYTNPTSSSLTANYSLVAYEYDIRYNETLESTVSANNFTLEISSATAPIVVAAPSSGGSSGGSRSIKPISLKIIVPEPISSRRKDRLVLPISLFNSGEVDLKNIFLQASVSKDGLFREDLIASFDNSVIDILKINEKRDLTLIIDANTEEYGLYEITLNATVQDPAYNDWAKIFINVEETAAILERILFTEEFITGNPECVELTELINEARIFLNAGAIDDSFDKLNEAIEACRFAIEQPPIIRVRNQFEKYLFNYVWLISLVFFMMGFLYYSYRRRKLKKGLDEIKNGFDNSRFKETFNNKKRFTEV